MPLSIVVFLVILLLQLACEGNAEQTVLSPDLIARHVEYSDIVNHHDSAVLKTETDYEGETLAFVTPWNAHGYDVVKQHHFTYVSPVWFNIRALSDGSFTIEGQHDVDKPWMEEVGTKIVPRFTHAGWDRAVLERVVKEESVADVMAQSILDIVTKHGFDGIVLDMPVAHYLVHLIASLSAKLHTASKTLIIVLAPSSPAIPLPGDVVDRYVLMTYDHSTLEPGPNAPISWVEDELERLDPEVRSRTLVGLNMYGRRWNLDASSGTPVLGEPVLGRDVVNWLEEAGPEIEWDKESAEHWFEVPGVGEVWYPSLKSLKMRSEVSMEEGCAGVSFWEVGQGLDYFYSIF